MTRALASALHVAASDAVSECWCPGEGCLLALVGVAQSVLQDRADELSEMMASMRRTTGEETSSRDFAVDAERTLGRKLIWFHHIKVGT